MTSTRASEDRRIWRRFYHHSRTFSLAARLLPRDVQLPVATLYLYCRHVDTIADQRVVEVGAERALEEVLQVRYRLSETLAGRSPGDLLWRRLQEVHAAYPLEEAPLFELIEGAVWDLEARPIKDLNDLIDYSNLVGGCIGALMLPFLVERPSERARLEPYARTLGVAMQITNIVRDVGEDLRQLGRVYLPHTWMEQWNLAPDNFDGTIPDAYPAVMERTMLAAEKRYEASRPGIEALPLRARLAIRSAARMYREIMNEVRALGYDNLHRRAYVPFSRKLHLIVQDDYARRRKHLLAQRRAHAPWLPSISASSTT